MTAPRVFIGLQEISGYYENLEKGFQQLGVDARLVTTHPHPFGYSQLQPNPWLAKVSSQAVMKHRIAGKIARMFWGAVYLLFSFLLMFWAIFRFKVFIFSWGESFLPQNYDLRILKLLNKTVIVVLGHGSEARPAFMSNLEDHHISPDQEIEWIVHNCKKVSRKIHHIEKTATVTVGLKTTAQFFQKPFVDFFALGLPYAAELAPQQVLGENDQPHDNFEILHVPSNPAVKGSIYIREAIDELLRKYPEVRFHEVSNRPHSEILEAIRNADLIVDQLWSDIPMAVVGVEAAASAKPSLISGYAWDVWNAELEDQFPPAVRCTPETLSDVLEKTYESRQSLGALGLAAQKFIQKQWNPVEIARKFVKLFDESTSKELMTNPEDVDYLWGVGVDKRTTLTRVKLIRDRYGWDSLRWPRAQELYAPLLVEDS